MPIRRPQRPRSHEVGDVGVATFIYKVSERWACNESESDYGWDIIVTIPSDPGHVGDQFFVQVKGSDNVNYLSTSSDLSHSLRGC